MGNDTSNSNDDEKEIINEILWVDRAQDITGDIIKQAGYKFKLFHTTNDCINYVRDHPNKARIKGIISSGMNSKNGDFLNGPAMINKIINELYINQNFQSANVPITAIVTGSITTQECRDKGIDICCNFHEMDEVRTAVQNQIITKIKIKSEIASITANPDTSRDDLYELAKQTYKTEGKPVIVDKNDALSDIKQNAANYKNVALPLTLGQDKPFNEWNEQQFKQDFSRKFNIPIACIEVISVRAGSCIIDLKLKTHSDGDKLIIPIEAMADKISNDKAKKELVEFGIFAMEFGKVTAGFDITKQVVIMNPRWNKEYRRGSTFWDGALADGKSRGNEPYYCPIGWKRFSVQFKKQALDFDSTYDHWPIAYHGTKFDFSMMITLSGLKCSPGTPPYGVHGDGVYLSPSIKYVSHPRYCEPVKLDLSKAKQKEWSQEYIDEFKKYDGKWVQCAFACRVKPGEYTKHRETMGLGIDGELDGEFDGIDKKVIEWLVKGTKDKCAGEIVGPEKILVYGIMIKARDTKPTGYHDY